MFRPALLWINPYETLYTFCIWIFVSWVRNVCSHYVFSYILSHFLSSPSETPCNMNISVFSCCPRGLLYYSNFLNYIYYSKSVAILATLSSRLLIHSSLSFNTLLNSFSVFLIVLIVIFISVVIYISLLFI